MGWVTTTSSPNCVRRNPFIAPAVEELQLDDRKGALAQELAHPLPEGTSRTDDADPVAPHVSWISGAFAATSAGAGAPFREKSDQSFSTRP